MNRGILPGLVTFTCGLLLTSFPATAQTAYRNLSSVHDGAGAMSSGGTYTNWGASGQPGGIFKSTNGTLNNYAGFLQAADIKHPELDTDGDGVIDEISLDNDGDGLQDVVEIEGSGFNPNTATEVNVADSDGDEVSDGDEATAGTNPRDEDSLLEIVSLSTRGDERVVSWSARGDGTVSYLLMFEDAKSTGSPPSAIAVGTVAGGAAPWFETQATYTNTAPSATRIYAVEASPVP